MKSENVWNCFHYRNGFHVRLKSRELCPSAGIVPGHWDGFWSHVSLELCHHIVQPWRAHRGEDSVRQTLLTAGSEPTNFVGVTTYINGYQWFKIVSIWLNSSLQESTIAKWCSWQRDAKGEVVIAKKMLNGELITELITERITMWRRDDNLCSSMICSSSWMKSKRTRTPRHIRTKLKAI